MRDPVVSEESPQKRFRVTGSMLSDRGCVREQNEDAVAYMLPREDRETSAPDLLALVADGMGGHAAGEVASQIAANTILDLIYELSEGPPPEALRACLASANKAILERSRSDPECAGLGTTCT